jgi:hypothetical protein
MVEEAISSWLGTGLRTAHLRDSIPLAGLARTKNLRSLATESATLTTASQGLVEEAAMFEVGRASVADSLKQFVASAPILVLNAIPIDGPELIT